MFCEKCGVKIDDDSLFCENCGAKQTYVESLSAQPVAESDVNSFVENTYAEPIVPVDAPAFGEEGVFEKTVSIFDTQQKAPEIYNSDSDVINENDGASYDAFASVQYTEPQYTEPQYTEPQYTQSQYTQSHYTQSQYTQSQYTQSPYAEQQYVNTQYTNYPDVANTQYPEEPAIPVTDTVYPAETDFKDTYTADTSMGVKPIEKKKKGKKVWVIILCIVLALALIGGGVVFALYQFGVLGGKKSDNTDAPAAEVITENNEEQPVTPPGDVPTEDQVPVDENIIMDIINNHSEHTKVGVYVINLKTGYRGGYDYDTKLTASAMCQISILDALSNYVSENNINVDDTKQVFKYEIDGGKSDPKSKSQNGKELSVRNYIEGVARYGDNNRSNQLVDFIGGGDAKAGFQYINNYLGSNYPSTRVNRKTVVSDADIDTSVPENSTSAKDIASLFEHLIKNSSFGDKNYMKSIFKTSVGISPFFDTEYDVSGVNAINSRVSSDVVFVSKGDTEVVISILCVADESYKNAEDNAVRKKIQRDIIDHVLETQFED